jgi:hypothetical protein
MSPVFAKGSAPRYAQVTEALNRRIGRGTWKAGARLPSNGLDGRVGSEGRRSLHKVAPVRRSASEGML